MPADDRTSRARAGALLGRPKLWLLPTVLTGLLALLLSLLYMGDGVRAILYFDARGDAGLTRAWIMIAVGVVLALLFGFVMTRYYDRKGLERLTPQPS